MNNSFNSLNSFNPFNLSLLRIPSFLCGSKSGTPPRQASVLVGLLWCMALLSVLVIGVLRTARLDLLVVKNHGDQIQAHYLALAGIEKAKALLYQDALQRKHNAKNHSGELYDSPSFFRDMQLGRGQFRGFHQGRAEDG